MNQVEQVDPPLPSWETELLGAVTLPQANCPTTGLVFSGLLKTLLRPTPRVSVGLGWDRESAFLSSSLVMLILLVDDALRTTDQG